jgi:hypothetical protein
MTVTVYIWNPEHISSEFSALFCKNVGHVSVSLNNTYISHRPCINNENKKIKKLEYFIQTNKDYTETSEPWTLAVLKATETLRLLLLWVMVLQKQSTPDYTKIYLLTQPVDSAYKYNINYQEECKSKKRKADRIYKIDGLNKEKILCFYEKNKHKYHPLNKNCSGIVAFMILFSLEKKKQLELVKRMLNSNDIDISDLVKYICKYSCLDTKDFHLPQLIKKSDKWIVINYIWKAIGCICKRIGDALIFTIIFFVLTSLFSNAKFVQLFTHNTRVVPSLLYNAKFVKLFSHNARVVPSLFSSAKFVQLLSHNAKVVQSLFIRIFLCLRGPSYLYNSWRIIIWTPDRVNSLIKILGEFDWIKVEYLSD